MPDMKKTIKGLERCAEEKNDCSKCPYIQNSTFFEGCRFDLMTDALELLKEQQQRIEQLEIDRNLLVKDINTNNCNTCKRECEHRPILGDVVRVNCFMWEGR